MNIDLLLEAVKFVEQNPDHDYCTDKMNIINSSDVTVKCFPKQKLSRLRGYHNELERKRRADLRHNLELLKKLVPVDTGDKKISTVRLLNEAASYINRLREKHRLLDFEAQKIEIELKCLREEMNKYISGDKKKCLLG